MKKKFYLLLFAMVLTMGVYAQRFEYQLGLKAGVGVSFLNANDDDIVSKDNGLNYKFGLTGIYYFNENYGLTTGFNIISTDLTYSVKKYVDDVVTDETIKRNLNNTYCQIPLLLKMRTESFGRCRILGEVGYGLNVLVSEHDKYDFHHPYRDVCSSLIVHLGMEVEVLSRSTLLFILGYDNVFSNMMSDGNNKITTSNLCFELGFLF